MYSGSNSISDTQVRQVQYIVEAMGDQGVHDLRAALAAVNAEIAAQLQAYQAGAINAEELEKATRRLAAQQADLAAKVKLAAVAMANGGAVTDDLVTKFRAVETAAGGKSTGGGAAFGLMMVAQAADDAQYGFKSIVNNIPGLVLALTGNMGVAGAVAIVAVGINQLLVHWKEFEKFLDPSKVTKYADSIGGLSDRVKDLNRDLDDTAGSAYALELAQEKLDRAKIAQSAYDRLKGKPTDAERATSKAAETHLDQAGGVEKLAESLVIAKERDGTLLNRDEKAELKRLRDEMLAARDALEAGTILNPDGTKGAPAHLARADRKATDAFDSARAKASAAGRGRVEQQIGRFVGGGKDVDRVEIKAVADANPDLFLPGQKLALELSSPEYVKSHAEAKAAYPEALKAGKAKEESAAKAADSKAKVGNSFRAAREKTVDAVVKRFAPELKDNVDRLIARGFEAGKDEGAILAEATAFVAGRLGDAEVAPKLIPDAARKIARDGMDRFSAEVAGRDGPGGKADVAAGVLAGLDEKSKADAKRKSDAEQARLSEVASRQGKSPRESIQGAIVGAGAERGQVEAMPEFMQRSAIAEKGRGLAMQAKLLRDRADSMVPKTANDVERRAVLRDRAELLQAGARNPFPTESEAQANEQELLARRMTRARTKDEKGKVLSIDENRKVAAQLGQEARRDVDAKLVTQAGNTLTRQEAMLGLASQMAGQIASQEQRGTALDARLRQLEQAVRRPRQPNLPRPR